MKYTTSKVIFSALIFAGLSACASTTTPANDAAMATEPSAEKTMDVKSEPQKVAAEDAVRCKRMKMAGSNFKTKVCGTEEQWVQMKEQARIATGEMQSKSRTAGSAN